MEIEGVVAVIPRGTSLLVIRRSQHVVAPGMLCFPGGRLEAGESEQAGLVRELQEELAVTVAPERRLWVSVTPWQVSLAWWLCQPLVETPVPNPEEVETVSWMEFEALEHLPDLLESNHHFVAAWKRGEFAL